MLRIDEIEYDFIGKYEQLEGDATHLLSLFNCDISFPSQKKVKFVPTNATEKLFEYYSEREATLVRKLFRNDFIAFGYPDSFSELGGA